MVPLFGQNPAETRLIFTLVFIYQRHHYGLESRNLYFFTTVIFTDMQLLEKAHLYITVLTLLMQQLLVFDHLV